MLLYKDGITIEVVHPAEIRKYKGLGFVEVVKASPAPTAVEPTGDKPVEEKPVKPTKKAVKDAD